MLGAVTTLPECLACGTCCFSWLETYVRVTGDDHARLGAHAETLVRFEENRAYMRMKEGHCAALVLEPDARRFVCSVYEQRPATCRDLERGSPACRAELDTKGERPRLALRRRSAPRA